MKQYLLSIYQPDGDPPPADVLERIARVFCEQYDELPLERYYLFHAIRADLLRRLGLGDDAAAAYRIAIGLTENAAEIALLRKRLAAVSRPAR